MKKLLLTSALAGVAFYCGMATAGQYDATPLRGALSTEPHFQTSLGREGHRFAGAEINKYRLYDFYARQAEYHLEKKDAPALLLPYPGLEGGRRGHWGYTNEKLSSAVLNRTQEPRYQRLMSRGANGDQHVIISHKDSQSLCLFKDASPAMTKVILSARIHTPEYLFSHKVDRYGFDLALKGQDYLVGRGAEWHSGHGKPEEVVNDGYHLHQDAVIFRRLVGNAALLDMPRVIYAGDTPVYQRHLEWRGNSSALKFPLPVEARPIQSGKVDFQKVDKAWIATVSGSDRLLTHRVTSSQGMQGISLRADGGRVWVSFPPLQTGTTIQMASWITPTGGQQADPPAAESRELSALLQDSPRFFQEEITVKGSLNADPAASGTAYEIDDIPVPVENPYGIPMTTCGLAFDKDGSAYISTLVGDVWKVTGLDATLEAVTWQRFASGLNSPLGLEVIDGVLHVLTQNQILKLEDLNKDGEADLVRPLTKVPFPGGRLHNLCRDSKGNLYTTHVNGIQRISPDGATMTGISVNARNPFGLGVRPDGLALSDASEGNKSNGTCTIFESQHPENVKTVGKQRRILYLPRGIENSPGSRIFADSNRFGPLGKSLLSLSYGRGRIYQIMRDPNGGSPQAALRLLPGEFSSGACRLATSPRDGQLYIVGLDGWGDYAVEEGCLHRLRYTGKKELVPTSWKSYRNGVSVRFNQALDRGSLNRDQFFVQQWNYIDSAHTYGSGEYSVKFPDKLGHDRIPVESVTLSADGLELFIEAPSILPAMCTQIYGKLKSTAGQELKLDLYSTINQLPRHALPETRSGGSKNHHLEVPYKENNGNTYATLTEFFDKLAGRDLIKRPVGPAVSYKKEDLNFAWITKHILQANACAACHIPGQQFDFSTHESLMKSVDLLNPGKSHILGMINSESMPPFPMPTVAPEMKNALREWIEMGAPK